MGKSIGISRHFKRCQVCGDVALSSNFCGVSCESCRNFFRRNATRAMDLRCSAGTDRCHIEVDTRRHCASCRMAKCLAIGMRLELTVMKKMGSSSSMRVKRAKTTTTTTSTTAASRKKVMVMTRHLHQTTPEFIEAIPISGDQTQNKLVNNHKINEGQQDRTVSLNSSPLSPPPPALTEFASNTTIALLPSPTLLPFVDNNNNTKKAEAAEAVTETHEQIQRAEVRLHLQAFEGACLSFIQGLCRVFRIYRPRLIGRAETFHQAFTIQEHLLRATVKFCYAADGFRGLPRQTDQIAILKAAFFEIMLIRTMFYYDADLDCFQLRLDEEGNQAMYVPFDLLTTLKIQSLIDQYRKYSRVIKQGDNVTRDLMCVLTMFKARTGLGQCAEYLRYEFARYRYLLERYLVVKYQSVRPASEMHHRLMTIVEEVSQLREIFFEIYAHIEAHYNSNSNNNSVAIEAGYSSETYGNSSSSSCGSQAVREDHRISPISHSLLYEVYEIGEQKRQAR